MRISLKAGEGQPPTEAQRAAYAHFKTNGPALRRVVLDALFAGYPELREEWADALEPEDFEELLPDIDSAEDLAALIGLQAVHILNVEKDGLGYLGLQFGCTWDDEHGLGVMTHGDRIVKIGGADTSFLEWIAKADADGRARPGGKRRGRGKQ